MCIHSVIGIFLIIGVAALSIWVVCKCCKDDSSPKKTNNKGCESYDEETRRMVESMRLDSIKPKFKFNQVVHAEYFYRSYEGKYISRAKKYDKYSGWWVASVLLNDGVIATINECDLVKGKLK